MRARPRAITLTELLVVVSIIGILSSLISPLLIRTRQEALRHACLSNLMQMHRAASLYASGNNGKFPRCFDVSTPDASGNTGPIEASWWFDKLWRFTYPTLGELGTASVAGQQLFLRCPASRDAYAQDRAPNYYPKTTTTDKDRVFDDSYGYNNMGYSTDGGTTGFGFVYSNASPSPAVDPMTYRMPYYAASKYYRPYGQQVNMFYCGDDAGRPVQGQFMSGYGTECPRCRRFWFDTSRISCPNDAAALRPAQFADIGAWSDFSQPASTLLIMDYCKADANPFPGVDEGIVTESNGTANVTTAVTGYVFRHGRKANALFAAGNAEAFSPMSLFPVIGTPRTHWQVYR